LAELELGAEVDAPHIPYGGVACTSVDLQTASAREALLALREVLQIRTISSITKVRLSKCSITADVFSESPHAVALFSIKVRVFQRPVPTSTSEEVLPLVVEFQRRSGDTLAFGQFFATASAYLKDRFCTSGDMGADTIIVAAPPAVPGLEVPSSDDLTPLVDDLNATSLLIRAEALASLVVLAKAASSTAIAVCTAISHIQGLLAALMANPSLHIAYLAARLSSSLAEHGCVDDVLAATLQRTALETIVAESTNPLVRSELATFMLTTLKQPSLEGSKFQTTQRVYELVDEALQNPNCRDPAIQNCLYEFL
jgi:hypothetical protein